jgi:hypothetical protein
MTEVKDQGLDCEMDFEDEGNIGISNILDCVEYKVNDIADISNKRIVPKAKGMNKARYSISSVKVREVDVNQIQHSSNLGVFEYHHKLNN